MSNRRRVKRTPNGDATVIVDTARLPAVAAAYRCGHCSSDPATLHQMPDGVWSMRIPHDEGCPVLTGAVTDHADTLRALSRARQS